MLNAEKYFRASRSTSTCEQAAKQKDKSFKAPANNCYSLRQHVLPLVLVVHVHAGEEDPVGGVGVDPAQEDDVLLVVDVPHVLQTVHGATVGLSNLSRNQKMTDHELVVPELTSQRAQCLYTSVTIHLGNAEKLDNQVSRNCDCSQSLSCCRWFQSSTWD